MVLRLFAADVALGAVELRVAGEKEAYVGGWAPERREATVPSLREGVDGCCWEDESKGSPRWLRGVDMCSNHGSCVLKEMRLAYAEL
jgi:hypothetical protein